MAPLIPGIALCAGAAALAGALSLPLAGVSPLIIAIVLGLLTANTVRLPSAVDVGITFSAKKLLRVGIVLLGLQVVLSDILGLGVPIVLVVIAIVVIGMVGTVLFGRILGVPRRLALLIACGFSICGAAAVAASAGVTSTDEKEDEEQAVTAVALVVIFGTLMIPALPVAASALDLEPETAGLWAGGSIHEIAQVVAVGGALGASALTVAVIVKLSRVLLLAPVIAILSIHQRSLARAARVTAPAGDGPRASPPDALPPIVPLFVVGFLAMVVLRSFVALPEPLLAAGGFLQTAFLSAAMFGLGCGVRIRKLLAVGVRPFALAAVSTLLVAGVALGGIVLAGPL